MTLHLINYLLPLLISTICIIKLRPIAIKLNLVDTPGGRKMHQGKVPLIGGIAIFIAICLSLLGTDIPLQPYRSLLAAMAILAFIGVLDDLRELRALHKLIGQLLAILLLLGWGQLELSSLGNLLGLGDLHLSYLSYPLTVFALVAMINAINFIDGSDGLAGSIVFVHIASLMIACILAEHYHEAKFLSLILASLFGFLLFNFPIAICQRRKVFMGDAGSMLLGLLLGWFTIKLSQGPTAVLKPVSMLWITAFPLIDTGAIILRRLSQKKSPFNPDKLHGHHILKRSGYGNLATVLIITIFSVLFAGVGIVGGLVLPEWLLFGLFILLFVAYIYLMKHAWIFSKIIKRLKKAQS